MHIILYTFGIKLVSFFAPSLGCGIGFGYLHRIPAHSGVSMAPSPLPVPEEQPPVMPTHGFTEVSLYTHSLQHQLQNKWIWTSPILYTKRMIKKDCVSLLTSRFIVLVHEIKHIFGDFFVFFLRLLWWRLQAKVRMC